MCARRSEFVVIQKLGHKRKHDVHTHTHIVQLKRIERADNEFCHHSRPLWTHFLFLLLLLLPLMLVAHSVTTYNTPRHTSPSFLQLFFLFCIGTHYTLRIALGCNRKMLPQSGNKIAKITKTVRLSEREETKERRHPNKMIFIRWGWRM